MKHPLIPLGENNKEKGKIPSRKSCLIYPRKKGGEVFGDRKRDPFVQGKLPPPPFQGEKERGVCIPISLRRNEGKMDLLY